MVIYLSTGTSFEVPMMLDFSLTAWICFVYFKLKWLCLRWFITYEGSVLWVHCFRLYSKLSSLLIAAICHTWYSFVCEICQFVHILRDLVNREENDQILYPCTGKFTLWKARYKFYYKFFYQVHNDHGENTEGYSPFFSIT